MVHIPIVYISIATTNIPAVIVIEVNEYLKSKSSPDM